MVLTEIQHETLLFKPKFLFTSLKTKNKTIIENLPVSYKGIKLHFIQIFRTIIIGKNIKMHKHEEFYVSHFLLTTMIIMTIPTAASEIVTMAQIGKMRPIISLSSLYIGIPKTCKQNSVPKSLESPQ